jgi:hypothetical protein
MMTRKLKELFLDARLIALFYLIAIKSGGYGDDERLLP